MTRRKGISIGPLILGIVTGVAAGVPAGIKIRDPFMAAVLSAVLGVAILGLLWLLSVLVTSPGRRRGGSR